MGKAGGKSGSTTQAIAILGETAGAVALARLCSAEGMAVSVLATSSVGSAAPDFAAAVGACDCIIDARPEGRNGKADALLRLEAAIPAGAIIVVVASHRPVEPRARKLDRPGNFAGLVLGQRFDEASAPEIVRTRDTSDDTVARLDGLLRRVGKNPIVVRDGIGFFSPRVAGAFLNEAMALIGEGVPAAVVESAALESGMRAGPLSMLDEMSLKIPDEILHQELHDLEHEKQAHGGGHDHDHDHDHDHEHEPEDGHRHGHAQHDDLGNDQGHDHDDDDRHADIHDHGHGHDQAPAPTGAQTHQKPGKHAHSVKSRRMPEPAVYVMEKMAHGFKRLGRASGAGFYDYNDDGTVALWTGLKVFERRTAKVPAEDIRDRLLVIQALEAVRCREEGVVASLKDADTGLLAYGFPGASGGIVGYINSLGTGVFVKRAAELATRYGERFRPPAGLADLASRGRPLAEQPDAVPASRAEHGSSGRGPES